MGSCGKKLLEERDILFFPRTAYALRCQTDVPSSRRLTDPLCTPLLDAVLVRTVLIKGHRTCAAVYATAGMGAILLQSQH